MNPFGNRGPKIPLVALLVLSFSGAARAQSPGVNLLALYQGASSSSTSVATSGPVTVNPGRLYLASVTSKSYKLVTKVSGLGGSWTLVGAQCGGRNQTGVTVWKTSSAVSSGVVSATLSSEPDSAVIVVAEYSGVDLAAPIGAVVSANTNGSSGTCSGGVDSSSYAVPLTTTSPSSRVVGAVAIRSSSHEPGVGWVEQFEVQQGSGGSAAGMAIEDQERALPSPISVTGALSGTVDWATIAIEIKTVTGPPEPQLVRGPYLQSGTADSMVVRWRTSSPSDSRLSYGPAPGQLTTTISLPASVTEHEIQIDGLEPDTAYYYGVGSSSGLIAGGDDDHFFVTPPPPGTQLPIRIWVIGDSGQCAVSQQGCDDAAAVRDRYLEYAGADIADVWLMLGDNAYDSGTDSQYTTGLFEVYPEVLRNTVLWPVPGNHEFGASDSSSQSGPYYEAFTLPSQGEAGGLASGTEAYYSFDYGNVHFIALDSHDTSRSPSGSMYAWLEADLMTTDADWVIAYWHHPPYTKSSHDSDSSGDSGGRMFDMREIFLPLLEGYGLDLQLTGHSHSYERSMLIDMHYGTSDSFDPQLHALDSGDGDPQGDGAYAKATLGLGSHEGSVYSVVGSSSKNSGGLSAHPIMVTGINFEGSMVVDIDGATLDAVFIDKDGVIGDRFRIEKTITDPEPDIAVSPLSVTFDAVGIGSPVDATVTVSNVGTAPLQVSSSSLTGDSAFSVVSGGDAVTLQSGESQDVVVEFLPGAEGSFSGVLTVASDDPDEATVDVALSGDGVAEPDIQVAPTLDFGSTPFGTTQTLQLRIDNVGNATLTVTRLGTDHGAFRAVPGTAMILSGLAFGLLGLMQDNRGRRPGSRLRRATALGLASILAAMALAESGEAARRRRNLLNIQIPAGGYALMDIEFTPSSPGSFAGTLTIASNDPDERTVPVSMSGVGLPAP